MKNIENHMIAGIEFPKFPTFYKEDVDDDFIAKRTKELIEIHMEDKADMVAYFMEEETDNAQFMFERLMNIKDINPYVTADRVEAAQATFNGFIMNKCRELAENEEEQINGVRHDR